MITTTNNDMVAHATVLIDESSHGVMGVDAIKDALLASNFDMEFVALTVAYFYVLNTII